MSELLTADEIERGRAVIADAQKCGYHHVEIETGFILKLISALKSQAPKLPEDIEGLVARLDAQAEIAEQSACAARHATIREASSAIRAMAGEKDKARTIVMAEAAERAFRHAEQVEEIGRSNAATACRLLAMTFEDAARNNRQFNLDEGAQTRRGQVMVLKRRAEAAETELSSLKREVADWRARYGALAGGTVRIITGKEPHMRVNPGEALHDKMGAE